MTSPAGPIPYIAPEWTRNDLLKGTLRLVGATIRDRNNVVRAHMEILNGGIGATVEGAKLGPIGAVLGLTSSVASNVQTAHLQQTVNTLKLIATAGTVASVANLGVSVVGFAAVMHRLGKMDAKLDHVLAEIDALRRAVEHVSLKLDVFSLARLRAMGELLSVADATSDQGMRKDQLLRAATGFSELRSYYVLLLRQNPLSHYDVPTRAALEAYARFTTAGLGELKARLLLNDTGAYRRAAEQIGCDAVALMSMTAADVYEARWSGAARHGPAVVMEYCPEGVGFEREIKQACSDLNITRELLVGEVHVADYLEQNDVTPQRYLRAIREIPGEAIILPVGKR